MCHPPPAPGVGDSSTPGFPAFWGMPSCSCEHYSRVTRKKSSWGDLLDPTSSFGFGGGHEEGMGEGRF